MSEETVETIQSAESSRRSAPPVHIQFMAVLADGQVMSYSIPLQVVDQASVNVFTGVEHSAEAGSDPEVISRSLDITCHVQFHGPLDRDGGLYQEGHFGGVAPAGEFPGRDVPDYVVAHLAQVMDRPPRYDVPHNWVGYNAAVRAQATATAQWVWLQAFHAGMMNAERMGLFRQRIVSPPLKLAGSIKVPLFTTDGAPVHLPELCLLPECRMPVTGMQAPLDGESDGKGLREVTVQPCGHRIWYPDPVELTLS